MADIYTGFAFITHGIDTSRPPTAINPGQLAFSVNNTLRGGMISVRPRFRKIPLQFESEETAFAFATGRFQGASVYRPDDNQSFLVAMINGQLFRTLPGGQTSAIPMPNGSNPVNRPQAWSVQAEQWQIWQDGQSPPVIYNGSSARRAIAALSEIPVGKQMDYGMGRLWVVLPDGRQFIAGDLVYSDSGTPMLGFRDSVLKFTENQFWNGGGAFVVPAYAGQITALRFMANLDTAMGSGPLMVLTDNIGFTVDAPVNREVWQNLQYPIQTVATINYGALAQDSTVLVNGDLFYRSRDGIRSLRLARRDFASWSNTPISEEAARILQRDDPALLGYGSMAVFDNRVLLTVSPVACPQGVWHRAILSLDLAPISTMSGQTPPQYEGIWTGLRFLKLVKGVFGSVERLFIYALSECNHIELWELTDGEGDIDGQSRLVPVQRSFESAGYDYDKPFALKRIKHAEWFYDKLTGMNSFTLQFRSDQNPCWQDWISWVECANHELCSRDEQGCPRIIPHTIQYRTRRKTGEPTVQCDTSDEKPAVDGYSFQIRLEVTGSARIRQMRLAAAFRDHDTALTCSDQPCRQLPCCTVDPFGYRVEPAPVCPPEPEPVMVLCGETAELQLYKTQVKSIVTELTGAEPALVVSSSHPSVTIRARLGEAPTFSRYDAISDTGQLTITAPGAGTWHLSVQNDHDGAITTTISLTCP
jgi:hypothetical protein